MVPLRQPVGFGTAIGTRPRTVRVLFTGRVGAMTRFIMRCCRICRNSRIAPSFQFVRFDAMRGREVDPPPKHHKCSPCGAPDQVQPVHIKYSKTAAHAQLPHAARYQLIRFFCASFRYQTQARFLGTEPRPDSGHRSVPRFWARNRAWIPGKASLPAVGPSLPIRY